MSSSVGEKAGFKISRSPIFPPAAPITLFVAHDECGIV